MDRETHIGIDGDDLQIVDLQAIKRFSNREDGEVDFESTIAKKESCITATLLQSWTVCALKGKLAVEKTPKDTISSYGVHLKCSGEEFEEELILNHKEIWSEKLFSLPEKYRPTKEIVEFDNLADSNKGAATQNGDKSANYLRNIQKIRRAIESDTPFLFYQTQFYYEGPFHIDEGKIDLIYWSGKCLLVGEVKLTPNPKWQTALQLAFYQKAINQIGDLVVEPDVFIFHSKKQWVYDHQGTPWEKDDALKNTQLKLFSLPLIEASYKALETEIRDFIHGKKKPDPASEAKFIPTCCECSYRSRCYSAFNQQSHNPTLDKAGLDESEIDICNQKGIFTVSEAISRINELPEIHNNQHIRIKNLVRRFTTTKEIGGYSTWTPPTTEPSRHPHEDNQIYFFLRYGTKKEDTAWFTLSDPENPSKCIPPGQPTVIYTFSKAELKDATRIYHAHWLKNRDSPKPQNIEYLALENELEDTVTFPFPNLTLRGISHALQHIVALGSWNAYYESNSLQKDITGSDQDEKEETHNDACKERSFDLITLYQSLIALYKKITKEGTEVL